MKFKNIFSLFMISFLFCFMTVDVEAQPTGIRKFATVAAMNSYTPNVAQHQAMMALVTSGTLVSTLYHYDQVSSSWTRVGDITVNDGTTIDFTFSGGTLTAEIAQNGATTNQYLKWNGSAWGPSGITVSADAVSFTSGNFSATDVEAALEELFTAIDGTFAVGGSFNSDALAGAGSIGVGDYYTAGDDHIDGVREGTVIKRIY